jgi:membrane-bound ClpP family serine protease
MKRIILLSALFLFTATSLISCRETTEKETVIKEVQVEKAEPAEERKGVLERAGERVDAEANKKIDKEIDKIGDGN